MIIASRPEEEWRKISDELDPDDAEEDTLRQTIIRALNIGSTTIILERRFALMIQTFDMKTRARELDQQLAPEREWPKQEPDPGVEQIALWLTRKEWKLIVDVLFDSQYAYGSEPLREKCKQLRNSIKERIPTL